VATAAGVEEPSSKGRFYAAHGWGTVEKLEIEQRIRELGIAATILRPAAFMEDFTSERFLHDDSLAVPVGPDMPVNLIALADVAAFAAIAFADPGRHVGTTLEIAGDSRTTAQLADAIARATGRPVTAARIPMDVLWAGSPEAAKVFEWGNNGYYAVDLPPLREIHPGLMDFETWLAKG
jgi:uncharacterized protein YbjT (DUF2867 family)